MTTFTKEKKDSGVPNGSRSIKTPPRQWLYHFYQLLCDQLAVFSFRALMASCDINKQLTVSLSCQVQTLVSEIKKKIHKASFVIQGRFSLRERTSHVRFKIRNFYSGVEKYFTCLLRSVVKGFFQHMRRNFISPRDYVLSPIW